MVARKPVIDGRYEQRNKLGEGGMGIVYLANDLLLQQPVALKIMTGYPEDIYRDQKAREKFKVEIQIAKELDHPHVLRALDSGEIRLNSRKLPYLISEYIPEGSLQDLISKRKILPWEHWTLTQTADVIMQAAQGLWYLHTRIPIIAHRDVKPGNFLFHSKQSLESIVHLYLCDFGLARKQKTEADLTSEGLGTLLYMAPEQAEGGIHYLADQYALAVMTCYLLTGRYPIYASTSIALLLAHKKEKPLPPSTLNPVRINSGKIDAVILKALEKKPHQRFPSIMEFARELQSAIQDQVLIQAIAPTEPFSPTDYLPMSPQPAPSPILNVEPEFFPISLDHIKPYQQENLDELLPGKPAHRATPSAKSESGLLPVLKYKQLLSKELPARPNMLCWSWDGNYIACLFNNYAPVLVDRKNNLWNLPALGVGHMGCWTPDKHVFVISSKSKVGSEKYSKISICHIAVNSEWPPTFPLFRTPSIDALDVSCHRLLAVWVESQILIYQLPQWSSSISLPLASHTLVMKDMFCGNIGVLRWSPDGSMLAIGARNGAVVCWHLDTQTIQWSEPPSNQRIYGLAWTPDSTSLAVAFSDKRVVVWSVFEQRERAVWEKLSAAPHMLSISNQSLLAVASSKPHLLFGGLDGDSPATRLPGYRFATWSPTRLELATLDPEDDTTLVIWQE